MPATLTESARDAVTLTQAVDFVPGRPNISTLWRWATKGVRGIRLATVIIGGRRMVTPRALEDFLQRLNADQPADEEETDADLQRRAREAAAALERLGC